VLAARGIRPDELEVIIVGTVTPDMMFPPRPAWCRTRSARKGVWGFDVSGGLLGIHLCAAGRREDGGERRAQQGSGVRRRRQYAHDRLHRPHHLRALRRWRRRGAAGACEEGEIGFIDSVNEIDGSGGVSLYMPGGGSLNPSTHETVDKKMHFIHQDGPAVYKFAVRKMAELTEALLERNGVHRRGSGLLHSPSGQQAHHHGHGRPAGHEPRSRDHQY
jgi:3-oxoacyl-[acyl-carrier-protein] synthase III